MPALLIAGKLDETATGSSEVASSYADPAAWRVFCGLGQWVNAPCFAREDNRQFGQTYVALQCDSLFQQLALTSSFRVAFWYSWLGRNSPQKAGAPSLHTSLGVGSHLSMDFNGLRENMNWRRVEFGVLFNSYIGVLRRPNSVFWPSLDSVTQKKDTIYVQAFQSAQAVLSHSDGVGPKGAEDFL